MPPEEKKTLATIVLTLVGALLAVVVGALLIAYSGAIDVAATDPPTALTT